MLMPLPIFNTSGDLLPGVHQATLSEVIERFGAETGRRALVTTRLRHIYDLAQRTGHLQRLIIFGSYVTTKAQPNDVDVILVMNDEFKLKECPVESVGIFDHAVAQACYGASIFWTRPSSLFSESLDEFIAHWQIKRDNTQRGIVDLIWEK
jgi:hypothetical protein